MAERCPCVVAQPDTRLTTAIIVLWHDRRNTNTLRLTLTEHLMSNPPPFDQPFQPISAEFGQAMLEFEKSGKGLDAPLAPAAAGSGAKGGLFFLVVAFAEKDEAKSLGARWEAKARKWYVPEGKDKDLFKRWWPAA